MASAAGTLKRVTLELGGNDAAIVLDDVDPKVVAPKLFFAGFVNSGQVCMAVKRIYAHEKIYDALCAALAEEARKWTVGDGLDPATKLGPIQNRMQYDKVVGILDDTKRSGARFLAGGEVPQTPGYFFNPDARHGRGREQPHRARRAVRPHRARAEVHGRRRRPAPRQRHALRTQWLSVEPRSGACRGHRRAGSKSARRG